MKTALMILVSLMSVSAFAYKDGTYTCKSGDATVPPSEYKIETVAVGSGKLPYIEATRHYRADIGNVNSPLQTATMKGFAAVSQVGDRSALLIAAMRFEFEGDTLLNCKQ